MPKVSVVIPTCNRSDKVYFAIDSVVKQTFTDIEIIVVNDGEDDGSVQEVIDKFADRRVRYLRNQRKKGANGARNTGFLHAKGFYIAFLDDDDTWYPEKIQKQMQKFIESSGKVGMVYSGYEIVSTSSSEFSKKELPQKKGKLLDHLISGNFIGSPTPLIKKEIFNDAEPYDEELESAQDWELWIRLSTNNEIEYVDEILATYVVHGDQISADFKRKAVSFEYIIKKYNYLYDEHKKALSTMYKRTAVLLFLSGKFRACRSKLLRAFITDIFRIDIPFHFILSFFPGLYRRYIDKHFMMRYGQHKLIY